MLPRKSTKTGRRVDDGSMKRSGLVERPFEQCPVKADFVAKVGDRTAVASQLTQTRQAAPSHSITSSASASSMGGTESERFAVWS